MFRSMRRVESRTPAVEVLVSEPPLAGRPEGYVPGTIGPVILEATVDRDHCSTGETATISVRARSEGSLSAARLLFDSHVDGARIRTTDGRTETHALADGRFESVRVTEILVVPERAGPIALGPLRIPYFDPSTERYDVASVVAPIVTATGDVVERDTQRPENQDPTMTLRGLSAAPSLKSYTPWFYSSSRALLFAVIPSTSVLLLSIASWVRQGFVRRRKTENERRKRDPYELLLRAKQLLREDAKEACAQAARAMQYAIEQNGGDAALSDTAAAAVSAANEALDAVRFAATGDAGASVGLVETAIRAIEAAE
jgi:hypothetical protein